MTKRSRKSYLITTAAYQGYYVDDVLKILYPTTAERLRQWLSERNVTLHRGRELIRKEELEFFLKRQLEATDKSLLLDVT